MFRMNRKKLAIMATIMFLAIGFAAISSILYINGTISIGQDDSFRVFYSEATMSPMKEGASIERKDDFTNLVFNVGLLNNLGEEVVVDYKIKNDSRHYKAEVIIDCTSNGTSEYLDITNKIGDRDITTITSATPLYFEADEEKNGKITVKLDKSYAEETNVEVPITCEINAKGIIEIPTSTTVPIANKLCKRATSLHSDGTHTFGSLGTEGTLTSGDAFDCDVDGRDGYNSETERFYYVTDLDEETAVLIYYSNTNAGVADASKTIAYYSGNGNNLGPITAVSDLPSKDQWVTQIYSNPRQITNESGGTTTSAGNIVSYNYDGLAARLITMQELRSACGRTDNMNSPGNLDTCPYIMENTHYADTSLPYGYWLENTYSGDSLRVWYVSGDYSGIGGNYTFYSVNYGARPAIEVKKSDISY